jgi:hypothetical protein
VGGAHLVLHLGTAMPERDGALLEGIAAGFRLLQPE